MFEKRVLTDTCRGGLQPRPLLDWCVHVGNHQRPSRRWCSSMCQVSRAKISLLSIAVKPVQRAGGDADRSSAGTTSAMNRKRSAIQAGVQTTRLSRLSRPTSTIVLYTSCTSGLSKMQCALVLQRSCARTIV